MYIREINSADEARAEADKKNLILNIMMFVLSKSPKLSSTKHIGQSSHKSLRRRNLIQRIRCKRSADGFNTNKWPANTEEVFYGSAGKMVGGALGSMMRKPGGKRMGEAIGEVVAQTIHRKNNIHQKAFGSFNYPKSQNLSKVNQQIPQSKNLAREASIKHSFQTTPTTTTILEKYNASINNGLS